MGCYDDVHKAVDFVRRNTEIGPLQLNRSRNNQVMKRANL